MQQTLRTYNSATTGLYNFTDEMTRADQEVFGVCEVLRGERSAVEAYEQVMRDVRSENWASNRAVEIESIVQDHKDAVAYWERFLRERGELSNLSSGPWGLVVETFLTAARIFGENAAFKILREGEDHGLQQYKTLAEERNLSPENREHILDCLIPAQMRHIGVLTAMADLQ